MGLTFLDFFSGIGGFRLGMEMAGHKCLGHCEIDKFADKSYRAMHDVKESEWYANDIRGVNPGDLPEVDCYCGGFPCQAFSIAGKRGGFEDTRGTLFFEVMRLAAIRKPKYIFMENVAGLLSHDGGKTFGTIINTLGQLGYWYEYQVLNSKNFGVPQNRERVFIIGHLGGFGGREVFPIFGNNGKVINQVGSLDIKGRHESACRVYGVDGVGPCLNTCGGGGLETKILLIGKDGKKKNKDYASCLTAGGHSGGNHSDMDLIVEPYKDDKDGNAHCIDANYYKGILANQDRTGALEVRPVLTPDRLEKRQNGRRMKENGEDMFTLTAQDKHGVYISEATKQGYAEAFEGDSINLAVPGSETRRGRVGKKVANTLDTSCNQGTLTQGRIRRLTPRECFRLQGFPDKYFERAAKVNSDSQLYKQAGNTVTVNVIHEAARRL